MPSPTVLDEANYIPIGDMLRSIAVGVAEAQWQLDKASMTAAEFMSGQRMLRDPDTGQLLDKAGKPVNEDDVQSGDFQPIVQDSRVYFGYESQLEDERIEEAILDDAGKTIIDSATGLPRKRVRVVQRVRRVPQKLSMLELGFTPTFYQFVDTVIEIKVTLRFARQSGDQSVSSESDKAGSSESTDSSIWANRSRGDRYIVRSRTLDAATAAAYQMDGDLAASVKTKIVPVPPPSLLEDRIRMLLEERRRELSTVAAGASGPRLESDGSVIVAENEVASASMVSMVAGYSLACSTAKTTKRELHLEVYQVQSTGTKKKLGSVSLDFVPWGTMRDAHTDADKRLAAASQTAARLRAAFAANADLAAVLKAEISPTRPDVCVVSFLRPGPYVITPDKIDTGWTANDVKIAPILA